MGYHDYVCFVQKNGQSITTLQRIDPNNKGDVEDEDQELDEAGSDEAKIVIVPKSVDVQKLKLPEFAKYPAIDAVYSSDDWSFKDLRGYSKALGLESDGDSDSEANSSSESEPNLDASVWTCPKYPESQLVNFDPEAYNCFVLQTFEPKCVPVWYYDLVLENRRIKVNSKDKNYLWSLIAGTATLPVNDLGNEFFAFLKSGGKDLLPLIAQYALPDDIFRSSNGSEREKPSLEMIIWMRRWKLIPTNLIEKNAIEMIRPDAEILKELRINWCAKLDNLSEEEKYDILHESVESNNLDVLRELRMGYKFTGGKFTYSKVGNLIYYAVITDNQEVEEEFRKYWNYNKEDEQSAARNGLKLSIEFGNVPNLRRIMKRYRLPFENISSSFISACRNGRHQILPALREFGFSIDRTLSMVNAALDGAVRGGHVETVRELRKFGLTKEDTIKARKIIEEYQTMDMKELDLFP